MKDQDSPFWLAFGDIHDDLSLLEALPEMSKAQGVIVTGDITLGGGVKQAERVLAPIAARSRLLFAQIGNMDRGEVTEWLEKKGWNLHGRARELFPGVMALGVGCSPITPFGTPSEYPETRLSEWMSVALEEALGGRRNTAAPAPPSPRRGQAAGKGLGGRTLEAYIEASFADFPSDPSPAAPEAAVRQRPRIVLVAHTPPLNTACDKLPDGRHVGSTAVREFIETHQPELCLCGHIHESRGEDRIGATQVVNPGTLFSGGYVILLQKEVDGEPRVVAEIKMLQ